MTVSPGWGGQPFIARSPAKIARLRALLDEGSRPRVGNEEEAARGAWTALEVDGGIEPTTAPRCREAGASLFVAGSAIFGASEPGEAYRAIARSIDAV
jgi:ribulose-phosphate 3-epimerase